MTNHEPVWTEEDSDGRVYHCEWVEEQYGMPHAKRTLRVCGMCKKWATCVELRETSHAEIANNCISGWEKG